MKALFKYPDTLPPRPPKILRQVGVNWLKDPDVAYSAWVIVNKRASNIHQGIRTALQTLCGAQDGLMYFRRMRLKFEQSHRQRRIVLLVQTDAMPRLKSNSLVTPVASTKRFPLFELDELQTGGWATTG